MDCDRGCAATVLRVIKPDTAVFVGSISTFCGFYIFLYHGLTNHTLVDWFTGYVLCLYLAGLYSVCVYARIVFGTVMDIILSVQYSTLATTASGEGLTHERRLYYSHHNNTTNSRTLSQSTGKDAFFFTSRELNTHSYWFLLTALLLIYNSIHLFAVPWDTILPLFFSTPAFVVYFVMVRCLHILQHM